MAVLVGLGGPWTKQGEGERLYQHHHHSGPRQIRDVQVKDLFQCGLSSKPGNIPHKLQLKGFVVYGQNH